MRMRAITVLALSFGIFGTCVSASAEANEAAPVAHSQSEFDVLSNRAGADSDLLGHAYDNQSARLFWFTDLEAAKKQAALEGKPILSLRLLGKLSDEYSCANSRFFRTVLYPNATINKILREKYVLHWSSERPVPVVTIDMGDGRILKRTLTGNSVHYLMDAKGAVLDALPGLYAPGTFASWLGESRDLADDLRTKSDGEKAEALKAWHQARLMKLAEEWASYRVNSSPGSLSRPVMQPNDPQAGEGVRKQYQWMITRGLQPFIFRQFPNLIPPPSPLESTSRLAINAEEASRLAIGKSLGELSLVRSLMALPNDSSIVSAQDRQLWGNFAGRYVEDAHLDENSRVLLASKLPNAKRPQTVEVQAISKGSLPNLEALTIRKFEDVLAFDTARNEKDFHARIHAVFVTGNQGDFASLNRSIYSEIFLTPESDPWLGLMPEGLYTALGNGGIMQPLASPIKPQNQ